MIFDLNYIWMVMLPGLLIGLWAQAKVKSAYHRASQIGMRRGWTGAQVAQAILKGSGVHDVAVEPTHGFLSDHYHPLKKVLRLSETNYAGTSLAAAGVAAHEVGHALQHAQKYAPLMMRSALVPVCQAGQLVGQVAMLAGALFAFGLHAPFGRTLLGIAILGYAAVFLFTLITLPVEFNASSRAMRVLADQGILAQDELPEAKAVLDAAALTYVASAVQVLLTLLYLISLFTRSRD
jgi:uncharacterized protein